MPEQAAPAAQPEEKRPVAAVRFPVGKIHGRSADRAAQVQAAYGPVLGTPEAPARVHVRNQGSFNFATASPDDLLYFPKDDARAGLSRYDWKPAQPGSDVLYGYLVEGALDR